MNQQCFFNEDLNINGLEYLPSFISREQEIKLLDLIDSKNWNSDLKRRTQHYGYKYDYKARSIDQSYYLGKMPDWIDEVCSKLYYEEIFLQKPDQVIINEYVPGQGISAHIDCAPCFTDTICSLSLSSGCIMDFTNYDSKKSIYLEPRSLLVLKGDARYKWRHQIAARKSDNGIKRQRRISLTFRKVILI